MKARTVRIEEPVDLAAFAGSDGVLYEHEGVGLAGRGEAMRISGTIAELPERVAVALGDIDGDDTVAVGALPFDRDAVGSLVVPRWVLRRTDDGVASLTTIGDDEPPPRAPDAWSPPDAFALTALRPHQEWVETLAAAVEAVRVGGTHENGLRKVVLAREVLVEANRAIPVADVVGRLRALYPACRVFSVDGFVGASPELLVTRQGSSVTTYPMAGTVARSGDPEVDARLARELLASPKEREEHALVVEDVARRLAPFCASLDVPEQPTVSSFRNVSHLGTRIHGRLHERPGPASALALAAALHPTPAVAGTPTDDALAFIAEVEKFDRGRYAGPVGWVDARGDGEWAVGIRAAELDGSRARLFAGVGIVAGSDPQAELVETQLKLQALLSAVVRP